MKKDNFDKLRDKTNRIVREGLKLAKRDKMPNDYCLPNCASCLSAEARGNVDKEDRKNGKLGNCILGVPAFFDSKEDVCMLEARDILAEKLDWIIR